jgi:predicted RNA binding protein YcfA (HicA-like mRNA interferase family)
MPKVMPCSRSEMIRKLRRLGFIGPFSGGKHSYMKRGNYRQIIPNTHHSDIDSEFIKEILKQAGISKEEWLEKKEG